MTEMKIGELAQQTDCQVVTIRYYEQAGLLPEPARSTANYRLYNQSHVERLSFIRHCRSLGMPLEEVRTLLKYRDTPEEDCGEVDALLDRQIQRVVEQIARLQLLERQLRELRSQCHGEQATRNCEILRTLSSGEPNGDVEVGGARD